ncbi:MAG: phenylalanine 4-monooxygenase [Stenotrophobium sp.]
MGKVNHYVARAADARGHVRYTEDENRIWAELYARQEPAIRGKACDEFVHGLDLLQLPRDRVPQLGEVSRMLQRETGWQIAPVPALIPLDEFFALLAQKRFPAATFVRRRDEMKYLKEPDIFHEMFGHTPMLTNRYFAEFTHAYGKLGLSANAQDREFLGRLYWFTVEFGLIGALDAPASLRIYGGGILSSIGETAYALGGQPRRHRFKLLDVLRTPYRINIMQPLYYVIEDFRELFELARGDLLASMAQARRLGLHAPLFEPDAADAPPPRSMPRASSA